MIEIVIVIVIAGLLYMLVAPRISEISARSSLRAARGELASAFSAARSVALQKGKTSTLTLVSNQASVSVLSGLNGQAVQVYGPVKFSTTLNSSVSPLGGSPTSISFDSRGLVTPVPNQISKYQLTSGIYMDTLCVSAAGILLPKGCQM